MTMRYPRVRWLAALLLLGLTSCGGGDSPTDIPLPATGSMSASIDGSAWSAAQAQAVRGGGAVTLAGTDIALLSLGLAFQDTGTGTYTLGPGQGVTASVSDPQNIWSANDLQGSGTITVTTLDATRVAGTFSFIAPASPNSGPPASRTVTSGAFDVPF